MIDKSNSRIKTRFTLLSSARSGTSAIISALRKHPQIYCHGEIFHHNIHKPNLLKQHLDHRLRAQNSFEGYDLKSLDFTNAVFNFSPGPEVVGFKMWYGQAPETCEAIMKDENILKIVLERKNRLAMFTSLKLASQSGAWGKSLEGREKNLLDVFDFDEFLKYKDRIDQCFQKYSRGCKGKILRIAYEDIGGSAYEDVLKFLGVDTEGTDVFMKKQNSSEILSRFNPGIAAQVREQMEAMGRSDWLFEK